MIRNRKTLGISSNVVLNGSPHVPVPPRATTFTLTCLAGKEIDEFHVELSLTGKIKSGVATTILLPHN